MAVDDILIFGGSGSPKLTRQIGHYLGLAPCLGEVIKFSEGSLFVRILENVRGRHVYLVQSTAFPANDNFMELLFWVDAFRRASAGSVTALIPYFSYAKGDKKDEPRVSIRARVCADAIEAASEGNRARLFKVSKGGLLTRLPVPIECAAYDATFSPNNRYVLAIGVEGVHLRHVSDGSLIRRYTRSNDFTRASFGPDGTVYLSGQKAAQRRSLEGRVLRTFRLKEYVYEHAVSPDGRLLATGVYGVEVWEVASGKLTATLEGELGATYAMAFSKDSSALYTASEYGAVTRYALPLGAPRLLFRAEDIRATLNLEATHLTRYSYKVLGTFRFSDEPSLPVSGTLPTADAPELVQGETFCALPINIGEGRTSWSVCGFPLPSNSSPPVRVFDAIRYTFSSDEEADLAFESGTEDNYKEAYWFVLTQWE